MVEALIIQQNKELAKELFHNMVVEKSRQIYEELLAEEFEEDDAEDTSDSDEEEADDDSDESDDESDESDDESDEVGGDASDDFISDVEDEGESDEMGEGDLADRMVDVEDALAELKAEFEELLNQEESEEEHDLGGDEFGSEEDEFGSDEGEFGSDEDELGKTSFGTSDDEEDEFEMMNSMFEYVNKVSLPKHGDDGVNKKSIVAKKNDMGGTTANIAKGGESKSGGTKGGLLNPSTKEENFGNVNVPGNSKSPKLSNVSKGHGAEKKGTGESAPNKKSIVGSK